MHLSEAVLATSDAGRIVLGAGIVLAAAATAVGLRKLDYERMPRVAVLSSAFFVVSLIHFPIGPIEFHLVLNGLIGLVLGWAAFPALLMALVLQAVLFGYGGILAVGINTVVMAVPAVVVYYLFHGAVQGRRNGLALAAGVAAGATGVLLGITLSAVSVAATGEQWREPALVAFLAHLAVVAVEGAITGSVVMFLRKVSPELLDALPALSVPGEIPHACAHDS